LRKSGHKVRFSASGGGKKKTKKKYLAFPFRKKREIFVVVSLSTKKPTRPTIS